MASSSREIAKRGETSHLTAAPSGVMVIEKSQNTSSGRKVLFNSIISGGERRGTARKAAAYKAARFPGAITRQQEHTQQVGGAGAATTTPARCIAKTN